MQAPLLPLPVIMGPAPPPPAGEYRVRRALGAIKLPPPPQPPPPVPPTVKPEAAPPSRRALGSLVPPTPRSSKPPPPAQPARAPPPSPKPAPPARAQPPPSTQPPSSTAHSVAVDIVNKYICSVVASLVSIVLVFCPALHYMWYGSFDKTILLWNEGGLVCGLANGIVWFVYGVFSWKSGKGADSVIAIITSSWSCSSSLSFILIRSGFTRKRKWVNLSHQLTQILGEVFGSLGVALLMHSHILQIRELIFANVPVQLISALVTVLPGAFFSLIQIVVTFLSYEPDMYLKTSCYVNVVAYPFEVALMTQMFHNMKKKNMVKRIKKTLKRNVAFRYREVDIESQMPANQDDSSSNLSTPHTVVLGEDEYYWDWVHQQQVRTDDQLSDAGASMQEIFHDEMEGPEDIQGDLGTSLQLLFQDEVDRDERQPDAILVLDDLNLIDTDYNLGLLFEEVASEVLNDLNGEDDIMIDADQDYILLSEEVASEVPSELHEEGIMNDIDHNTGLLFEEYTMAAINDPEEDIIIEMVPEEYNVEPLLQEPTRDGSYFYERCLQPDSLAATRKRNKSRRKTTLADLLGSEPTNPVKREVKVRNDKRTKSLMSRATRWLSRRCRDDEAIDVTVPRGL